MLHCVNHNVYPFNVRPSFDLLPIHSSETRRTVRRGVNKRCDPSNYTGPGSHAIRHVSIQINTLHSPQHRYAESQGIRQKLARPGFHATWHALSSITFASWDGGGLFTIKNNRWRNLRGIKMKSRSDVIIITLLHSKNWSSSVTRWTQHYNYTAQVCGITRNLSKACKAGSMQHATQPTLSKQVADTTHDTRLQSHGTRLLHARCKARVQFWLTSIMPITDTAHSARMESRGTSSAMAPCEDKAWQRRAAAFVCAKLAAWPSFGSFVAWDASVRMGVFACVRVWLCAFVCTCVGMCRHVCVLKYIHPFICKTNKSRRVMRDRRSHSYARYLRCGRFPRFCVRWMLYEREWNMENACADGYRLKHSHAVQTL